MGQGKHACVICLYTNNLQKHACILVSSTTNPTTPVYLLAEKVFNITSQVTKLQIIHGKEAQSWDSSQLSVAMAMHFASSFPRSLDEFIGTISECILPSGRHDWFYYTSTKCAIPDDMIAFTMCRCRAHWIRTRIVVSSHSKRLPDRYHMCMYICVFIMYVCMASCIYMCDMHFPVFLNTKADV
jgi:hypothetical protein